LAELEVLKYLPSFPYWDTDCIKEGRFVCIRLYDALPLIRFIGDIA